MMFGVKTNYKIKRTKDIQWLSPVLVQWLKNHRDYIEEVDCKDCLYWYNERANVSVLAGAMWKCGGVALEEYSSIKSDEDENPKNGRIDLYLYSHGNDAICEAKLDWIYLCEPHKQQKDFPQTIAQAIQKAKDDLTCTLRLEEYSLGIALNFIVAYSKDNNTDASISLELLQKSIKNSECDFYAWLELEEPHKMLNERGNNFNFVALIGTVQRTI